jgi:hypothetical protein
MKIIEILNNLIAMVSIDEDDESKYSKKKLKIWNISGKKYIKTIKMDENITGVKIFLEGYLLIKLI